MKKLLSIIFIAIFALTSVFALDGNVDAFIIPLTSGIYDDIDALYLISGKTIPSAARPWSYSEAKIIFDKINPDDVNPNLYNSVKVELESYQPRWKIDEGFGLGLNLIINPEIYLHTNSESFTTDTDWSYTYDERPVAAAGTIDLSVNNFFYSFSEFTFGISRYQQKDLELKDVPSWGIGAIIPGTDWGVTLQESDKAKVVTSSHLYKNQFSTNIPGLVDILDIDFTFPKRAIVSFGGPNWNLLFGRERVNWGGSNIGNFVIDEHVGFHEVLRFNAYTSKFKYEWTNLFLDTIPNVTEEDSDSITKKFKVMMNHRLEFRPFDFVSFAISESIMYIGDAFEVQNFNPAYIYHQLNNRAMFNSLAGLEIYVTPFKGLNVYFEFGLDNATLANEGDSQADANGFLVGAEYTIGLGNGYLESAIEFAQTSPIMYRRDGVDFLMLQRCYTLGASGGNSIAPKLYYIGFPYGPDAQVLHLGSTYKLPGVFEVGLDVNLVQKGEVTMFKSHNKDNDNTDKANLTGKTPTGDTITRAYEIALAGKYEIPNFVNWMDLTVNANLAYLTKSSYTKSTKTYSNVASDLQFAMGVTIKF